VSASKKFGRAEAVALARQARRLIAMKGKKVTTVELTPARPSDDALAALMLGPTGNLRAPTLRVGDTLLIGYNDAVFADACK
jgi:hypothetical protein